MIETGDGTHSAYVDFSEKDVVINGNATVDLN
jgi:hypothetical protein